MGRRKSANTVKCELWLELEKNVGYELEARQLADLLRHDRYEMERRWYSGVSIPDAISCKELQDKLNIIGLDFYLYCCATKYYKDVIDV